MTDHPDSALRAVLRECEAYFEERADAEYFPDSPIPSGNEEMRLLVEVHTALRTPDSRLVDSEENVERLARALCETKIEASTSYALEPRRLIIAVGRNWHYHAEQARTILAAITEGQAQ